VHEHLRFAVARDRGLKGRDHHVSPLGVIDPVADHEARMIVEQDQGEDLGPIDVTLDKVKVPQMVGADRFKAPSMFDALNLRRPVARRLHHPPNRVDRDFDALAAKLVFDLARAEAGVALVLLEDLGVPQLLN
jgi:hypothetical protein